MGKVLGKENHLYTDNVDPELQQPLSQKNRKIIEMSSPFRNYSKEDEEKQNLNCYAHIDSLLTKEIIMPKKYLEFDEKSIKKKKIYQPSYTGFSLNCIRKIVSRRKRRLHIDNFDLDLSYITERTIVMCYPSVYAESCYRNSRSDVLEFFERFHHNKIKIYNLCGEQYKIYPHEVFNRKGIKTANFQLFDHNPAPLNLILEFCLDITAYLSQNVNSSAAIHCKAGKGRSGLMVICYLLFTEMIENSIECQNYYAIRRSVNGKGLTISSQRRYAYYFQKFLQDYFKKPYISCLKEYFENPKEFIKEKMGKLTKKLKLSFLFLGPFKMRKNLEFTITTFDKVNIHRETINSDRFIEIINISTHVSEYFLKIIYEEGIWLEGDFLFNFSFDSKTQLKFWLNSNFIPKYVFMQSKNDVSIVAEDFDFSQLNYSILSIFSEKYKEIDNKKHIKCEINPENKPFIFKQETLKIHDEVMKVLKKMNENKANKKELNSWPIQVFALEELDRKGIKNKQNLKENFVINLIF